MSFIHKRSHDVNHQCLIGGCFQPKQYSNCCVSDVFVAIWLHESRSPQPHLRPPHVSGSAQQSHPGVPELRRSQHNWYVASLQMTKQISNYLRFDFNDARFPPQIFMIECSGPNKFKHVGIQ